MRFRNLSRWATNSSLDGLKFFAQRLDELLFDYTLDTYKPSALNVCYLTRETLELISDIQAGVIDFANLQPVLEELIWGFQNDKVARSLLDVDIAYYTAIANESEISSLKIRIEALERTVNPTRYLAAICAALKEKIQSIEKKEIDALASSFVTCLVNTGVSKQSIFDCVHKTFFSEGPEISDLSILDLFFETMGPKLHHFEVIFLVSANIASVSDSIGAFQLKIIDELSDSVKKAVGNKFSPIENHVLVKATDVSARDIYAARQMALLKLDGLSDLLALFQHRSRISWQEEAVVCQVCCDSEIRLISPPKGPMEKASDLKPEKAAKELNSLLRSFSVKGVSFSKFNRVADIHGICINHKVVENQLVNLWTALETLVPSHSGISKIANITNATLPFLMHAYIDGLVRQYTFDLLYWDKWRGRKILQKVTGERLSWKAKCLRLLCLEESAPLRELLYEQLKDFHLLRYRTFHLSEVLSDRKRIKALIERHQRRVSWQIRRLYRTRNLMVHSGRRPPPYIETLVENGHYYLDVVMFEVMKMSCGEYGAHSLEQIFEIGKIRYQAFEKKLSENGPLTSEDCDFLLLPQHKVDV